MENLYTQHQVYLDGPEEILNNPKVDIWSVGIILAELVINKTLWSSLKVSQCIRKILSLLYGSTSVFERIAREHNSYEIYQNLSEDIKQLIEDCLNVIPKDRPTIKDILKRDIFAKFNVKTRTRKSKFTEPFEIFTLKEFYHWWQLAGGDVLLELKKQGLIRSTPTILSMPCGLRNDGVTLGQERNPATLYDSRVVKMPLESLYRRFKDIPLCSYYPLIHIKSAVIALSEPPPYEVKHLPLVIKEKDPEYQFYRVILLRRLLYGYPFTRNLILKEAAVDIPPLLRGDVWAALLNVCGDYESDYKRIDKDTPTATDRQIEVDIPRCHQYNELLSSSEGHKKLKRILKAWIYNNPKYVYWQGLDSLTAPFLFLNFNNEAKAFACLSLFIPKYLNKFFLRDNSAVIHEYLEKFSQLIAFHDPILANHLLQINFIPELFAIPWFLTMFSHVFPLHKIVLLWDRLLLGDSAFPLHVGLAILTLLRSTLLNSGFNECILLFSDLPEVDMEQCIYHSLETYKVTPSSITDRSHQSDTQIDSSEAPIQLVNKEKWPRINVNDVVDLYRISPSNIIIIDIRNPVQFNRCRVKGSLNIPFSSISFGDANIDALGVHSTALKNSEGSIVVVIGTEEIDLDLFPKFLLQCLIPKVCVLHGGFNSLLSVTPSILTTLN